MRFRQIIKLFSDLLYDLAIKNCIGCQYGIENQQSHNCIQVDKWDYFREALEILYEKKLLSPLEYRRLLRIDKEVNE